MASPSRTAADYSGTAKLLHWLIAAFVIALLSVGIAMTRIGDLQLKYELYQLHKSMGVTVLGLMMLRVVWRLSVKPPTLPLHMAAWERSASNGTHALLYLLLLAMPLTGWATVSAALPPFNFPTLLYTRIPWPHIPFIEQLTPETKKTVEPYLKNVHAAMGWTLLVLVGLHIAAALRHGFILKDGIMLRMLPRVLNVSRKLIVPFAFTMVFAGGALPAVAQEWAIDKSLSKISFEAQAGGQAVAGEFKQFQAEIHFDPDEPDSAEISAAIDMNNVVTGQAQVDSALLGKDWFDTQTYPTAGFRARSVKPGSTDGNYVIEATVTIKDVSKDVTLPFKLAVNEGEATIKGETAISRSAFGIGPKGPVSGMVIGDVVKLRLDLAAKRLDN
jgi:cytochrome b561/polyisoprenoid-binding protein YceI